MSSRISFVRDVRLGITPRAVLARLGRGPVAAGDRWVAEARTAIDMVNSLAEPAIAFRRSRVLRVAPPAVELDDTVFESLDLSARMSGCEMCTLFLLTMGAGLDRGIDSLAGDTARQVVADAAGSEAAEACARWLQRAEASHARAEGCRALPRYSPGYGDFGLENQGWFAASLAGLGVTVTEGGMLQPRKSITGVIGWKKY